jgi:hypothetical protein
MIDKIDHQQRERLFQLREKLVSMETLQSSNRELGNYEWIRKELLDILNLKIE